MSPASWFSITESRYDIFNNTAWKYIRCASQTKTGDKKDFEGKKKVIWYWWKSQEEIENQRWRNKFWKWGLLFLFESWTKQSLTEIQCISMSIRPSNFGLTIRKISGKTGGVPVMDAFLRLSLIYGISHESYGMV